MFNELLEMAGLVMAWLFVLVLETLETSQAISLLLGYTDGVEQNLRVLQALPETVALVDMPDAVSQTFLSAIELMRD